MTQYLATDSHGNPFQVTAHSVKLVDGCLTFWSETGLLLALNKEQWKICELDTENCQKYHAYLEAMKK